MLLIICKIWDLYATWLRTADLAREMNPLTERYFSSSVRKAHTSAFGLVRRPTSSASFIRTTAITIIAAKLVNNTMTITTAVRGNMDLTRTRSATAFGIEAESKRAYHR